jgi:hypothetical protein
VRNEPNNQLHHLLTTFTNAIADGDIVHMHVAGFAVLWDRERTSESLGTLALRALHVAYRIRTLAQMPRYAHAALPLPAIGVARGPLALLFSASRIRVFLRFFPVWFTFGGLCRNVAFSARCLPLWLLFFFFFFFFFFFSFSFFFLPF